MSIVPLAHEVSWRLPGLHWLCFLPFWGQWCCSCLAVVLPGVTCLGVGSSNAVLQPGRCNWCEGGGKGGGATLCWEGLVGSAAPVSAGGSLPVTGTVRAH